MVLGERWSSAVETLAIGVSSREDAHVSCYKVLLQVFCDKAHAMLLPCVQQQRLRRQDAMRYAAWPHLRRQKTGFTKAVGRTTCSRCRPNCRTAGGAQLTTLPDAPRPNTLCSPLSLTSHTCQPGL